MVSLASDSVKLSLLLSTLSDATVSDDTVVGSDDPLVVPRDLDEEIFLDEEILRLLGRNVPRPLLAPLIRAERRGEMTTVWFLSIWVLSLLGSFSLENYF